MNAPSAYKMEQAMAGLMRARAAVDADDRLVDDATGEILDVARIEETAEELLHATLRAAVAASAIAKMIDERMSALKERLDRYKARSEGLRTAAFQAMEVMELRRVELPDMLVTVSNGAASVVITDEAALPAHCLRVVPETRVPDKVTIAANLKAGIDVPGAHLANGTPRLQIRTK